MVNNCRIELEDQAFIAAQGEVPQAFMAFQRPAEVGVEWHKTENQGRIGSCQGNDLSSCLERLLFVRTGQKQQLSRIFAYLATQKLDGLLGYDQGSTITGGMKLAMQVGVCPESLTGYPTAYPTATQIRGILSQANYLAGSPFKAATSCILGPDPEQAMNLIGGGGAVTFGIGWYNMIPADRIVRKYTPPAQCGGHANAVLGYTKDGLLIALNSWGDGPYKITPEAWQQMVKRRGNVFGGLMGNQGTPVVDWIKDSPWNFKG